MSKIDPFGAAAAIDTPLGERAMYKLDALRGLGEIDRLPYSIKVLLEACLRNLDNYVVTEEHVKALAGYDAKNVGEVEIPFKPGRVVLQDFTGVPAVVDLAAMRAAIVRMTGNESDAKKVNPLVPCDLVIDHSVQVDAFASEVALTINSEKEFERNNERYQFLKWGQQAFDNFRVVPPATGIIHQVNLEYLAKGVWESNQTLYPDSLVGTDSHTTMINGLGVVGWGVGGIEAEAVMLGQPIYMLIPEVVGFRLTGKLADGVTATDLVLRITEMLREHGVVGKFVEFFGPGLAEMPLANRATIANMAPEYGATMGFFPIDEQTTKYMELSGRDKDLITTVEQYCKAQGLWRDESHDIVYTDVLELDMSRVVPALSGPKRPQDRIELQAMQSQWQQDLSVTFGKPSAAKQSTASEMEAEGGVTLATDSNGGSAGVDVEYNNETFKLKHGAVTIAAITSCTNTSNPEVMLAAGLVARKANALGLKAKPWVKTSLAPGSKVVTEYYKQANLVSDLEALGFHTVGYGCTTCIGNSGPLPKPISKAINENDLVVASVLSGNRNFEGRISPDIKANYLASPPLVVAYAIAGTVDIDLQNEPITQDHNGNNVYLKDIWPSTAEVQALVESSVTREQFETQYADVFKGSEEWQAVESTTGDLYGWDEKSTYVQEPPFFVGLTSDVKPIEKISGARVLAKLADSVTTDHISPAGAIKSGTPAAQYLDENGVPKSMYNSYGSRRGNDRVMTRGTFANIRVKNQLAPGTEGGYTTDFTRYDNVVEKPEDASFIYDAVQNYKASNMPLVVLAGVDYGMGSSRDWAAKGTFLLNVKAVIAKSFERIHRSNLVGMGVLPLCFKDGQSHESLGLDGTESFDFEIDDSLQPRQDVKVIASKADGSKIEFVTTCRIDTPVEVDYYRNGGILHTVLRNMAKS
ncbi:Aconitate hydratase precursor [Poriferisphaera corsica]|uniref:Aconitate hydratase n=1 Tax=Poriferisphaera corsica TaxID=2528020 RepID=A0A517YWQ8_9BACT|nr:aconitate hydratase AcnA [Poriferisphaera corsica]QDU34637.1 Aconitate hydratase precursor [Poriferisphaera corsica]